MLLDDGAMERLAKAALKTVVKIENDPALSFDAARQAKDAYVGSIKDTLRAVATGRSGEVVAKKSCWRRTRSLRPSPRPRALMNWGRRPDRPDGAGLPGGAA